MELISSGGTCALPARNPSRPTTPGLAARLEDAQETFRRQDHERALQLCRELLRARPDSTDDCESGGQCQREAIAHVKSLHQRQRIDLVVRGIERRHYG